MNDLLIKTGTLLDNKPDTAYKLLNYINIDENDYENYIEKLRQLVKISVLIFNDLSQIETYIDKIQSIIELENDSIPKSSLYNMLAILFSLQGKYELAIKNVNFALNCADKEEDKDIRLKILNNQAYIYNKMGFTDKAKKILIKEINTFENDLRSLNFSNIFLTLGIIHKEDKQLNIALYFFKRSLENAVQNNHVLNQYLALTNISLLYKDVKDYKNAKKHLIESLELAKMTNSYSNVIITSEYLIEIYMKEYNYGSAMRLIYYMEDYILNNKENIDNIDIYYYAAKLYNFYKKKQKAIEMYKIYIELSQKNKKEITKQYENLAKYKFNISEDHEKMLDIYEKDNNLMIKKKKVSKLRQNIKIVNDISKLITKVPDIDYILKMLFPAIKKLVKTDALVIFTNDKKNKTIKTQTVEIIQGKNSIREKFININDETSIVAYCVRNKSPIFSNDYKNEMHKFKKTRNTENKTDIRSLIMLPLLVGEELIGGISVQSNEKNAYNDDNYNILTTLSSHIAIAVKNSIELNTLNIEIENSKKSQQELINLNKRLSNISYVDALTKIPNRRNFFEKLNMSLERCKQTQNNMVTLIIDIDFFKEYNDNYGHLAGDTCIKEVANTINNYLVDCGYYMARYGGDEFTAILEGVNIKEANSICTNITDAVKNLNLKHEYSKITDRVSVSIGAYGFTPNEFSDIKNIIQKTDEELYKAKDLGKNCHSVRFSEADFYVRGQIIL